MLAARQQPRLAPQASAGSIPGRGGRIHQQRRPGLQLDQRNLQQAGLRTTYISGVTDSDSYIASQPSHSYDFWGNGGGRHPRAAPPPA